MSKYSATSVGILADTDHGEGWVVFRWLDKLHGHEELRIDLDGHCSRRMPIHSGHGPPEIVELRRDGVRLRFDLDLARNLRLAEEIEILFGLSDDEFVELRRVVDHFSGAGTHGTPNPETRR